MRPPQPAAAVELIGKIYDEGQSLLPSEPFERSYNVTNQIRTDGRWQGHTRAESCVIIEVLLESNSAVAVRPCNRRRSSQSTGRESDGACNVARQHRR